MASNDPYELAKSEAQQARFERRALNSFGPDDPYDFKVESVAASAMAIALLPTAPLEHQNFTEYMRARLAKDPRTNAERLADARRERNV